MNLPNNPAQCSYVRSMAAPMSTSGTTTGTMSPLLPLPLSTSLPSISVPPNSSSLPSHPLTPRLFLNVVAIRSLLEQIVGSSSSNDDPLRSEPVGVGSVGGDSGSAMLDGPDVRTPVDSLDPISHDPETHPGSDPGPDQHLQPDIALQPHPQTPTQTPTPTPTQPQTPDPSYIHTVLLSNEHGVIECVSANDIGHDKNGKVRAHIVSALCQAVMLQIEELAASMNINFNSDINNLQLEHVIMDTYDTQQEHTTATTITHFTLPHGTVSNGRVGPFIITTIAPKQTAREAIAQKIHLIREALKPMESMYTYVETNTNTIPESSSIQETQ